MRVEVSGARASITPLASPRDDPGLDRVYTVDPRLLGLSTATVGAKLLDLGCGAGRHELAVAGLPLKVVGCDLSRIELRTGRYFVAEDAKLRPHAADPNWLQAEGRSLPFAAGTFDCAICSETLEHVYDDTAVLRELRRVVRDRGRLAVSVPAYWPERALWQLSWRVWHTEGGHLRIYRLAGLLARLQATGWKPYAIRRRHAFESVYWLLGAVGGGGDPPWWPARTWRQPTNSAAVRSSQPWREVERWLAWPLAKSVVVYARAV